jgi:S1-C subfamily serine protease
MQADDGLRVIHVEPESPGGNAGLTVGDVLTRFAGTDLDERRDLSATLATLSWSDEVSMELLREDEHEELVVAFRR